MIPREGGAQSTAHLLPQTHSNSFPAATSILTSTSTSTATETSTSTSNSTSTSTLSSAPASATHQFSPATVINIERLAENVKTDANVAVATAEVLINVGLTVAVPDPALVLSVSRDLANTYTHPPQIVSSLPIWPPCPTDIVEGCNDSLTVLEPDTFIFRTSSTTALTSPASEAENKYLADQQYCCPPPVFIILISLCEIGVFVYDYMTVKPRMELINTTIPSKSPFVYRPDRRLELWRFITYMLLHANWFHLGFNVVIQVAYGLPLELVHGSLRVAAIYLAGVFAGSLGTSVIESDVYLVGASGGVYALLAAHLANVLMNFRQMQHADSQLVRVVIFVACDVGFALYTRYTTPDGKPLPSVSYVAHFTGAMAGFTMGLLVLKNFDNQRPHARLMWWLALGVYSAFTIFAIVFNLINTVTAQQLEEQTKMIQQNLLHDLGFYKN